MDLAVTGDVGWQTLYTAARCGHRDVPHRAMVSVNVTSGRVGRGNCHCVQDTDTAVVLQLSEEVVTALHVSGSGE